MRIEERKDAKQTTTSRLAAIVAAGLLALGPACPVAPGGIIIAGPDKYVASASPQTIPAAAILTGGRSDYQLFGPTGADLGVMQRAYPGWTFAGGGNLNGILRVADFEAYASEQMGGASIDIGYTRAATDPALKSLEWIQVVNYVDPQGHMSLTLDNGRSPEDPGDTPFYFGPDQDSSHKFQGVYGFSDNPQRAWPPVPIFPNMAHLSWWADLYLATYDGAKGVTIVGGLQWGFQDMVYPRPPAGGGPPPGGMSAAVIGPTAVPEPGGLVRLLSGAAPAGLWLLVRRWRRAIAILAATAGAATVLLLALAVARPSPADRDRTAARPGPRLILRLPEGARFLPGEPIPVELELANDSPRPITIWECQFWQNHRAEVRDAGGNSPPETEVGQRCRQAFSPNGERDRNFPIRLAPGERQRRHGRTDLAKLFRLAPGDYRVRITYEDGDDSRPKLGNTYLKLASNWGYFRVVRPDTGKDGRQGRRIDTPEERPDAISRKLDTPIGRTASKPSG